MFGDQNLVPRVFPAVQPPVYFSFCYFSVFYLAEERCDSHISTSPRPQTPKFLTARAVFLVVTVVVVTMATRQAPTSRIVINTPAYFVKNGSKIFFNKDFHGRLLLSERLRARKQDFHQFGK